MSESRNEKGNGVKALNYNEILRAVVADAESMGLRDKDMIEKLTSQVIELLERPQILPGMEDFVPKSQRWQRRKQKVTGGNEADQSTMCAGRFSHAKLAASISYTQ